MTAIVWSNPRELKDKTDIMDRRELYRFKKKIGKTGGHVQGCWIWTYRDGPRRYRCTKGAGTIVVGGKVRTARWASYDHFRGHVRTRWSVTQVCQELDCVNPDHLVLVGPGRAEVVRVAPPVCHNGHDTREGKHFYGTSYPRCDECHRTRNKVYLKDIATAGGRTG